MFAETLFIIAKRLETNHICPLPTLGPSKALCSLLMESYNEWEVSVDLSKVYPMHTGLPEKELASYKVPWNPGIAKGRKH